MNKKIFLAAIGALLVAPRADATLPDSERQILEAFFEAANGSQWHRSGGWLQPGSDPCDWYGVECEFRFEIDRDIVQRLDLPGNNLSGTLDTRIFEIVHERLDLGDNAIGGTLDVMPASPAQVDLSNNELGGPLPAQVGARADTLSGTSSPSDNWYLDLSGNAFEGEVPPDSDWNAPSWLSLADNRLEGVPVSLFDDPGQPLSGRFLDLAGNRFSGAIPASVMDQDYLPHNGQSRWGGGLNLCWNDWSIPESVELRDWLRDHHVGGEFEQCLAGERQPIDPTISGSWYDPARSGEGLAVQQLDNGASLVYLFTFDENGRQQWLFDIRDADENSVDWNDMLRTRGRFGEGLIVDEDPAVETRGALRIDRSGDDALMTERIYIDQTSLPCLAVFPPPLSCQGSSLSDRLEYQRLSQLAGTTCDTQSDFQQYSGAWYNPERAGEGFLIEVLPDNAIVVYWFTHKPDDSGEQAWMIGSGSIEHAVILAAPPPGPNPVGIAEIEPIHQPLGGVFGEDFDPAAVEFIEWGSLTLELLDDDSMRVRWDSQLDGFGTGDYALERLTRPLLAECELEE